jgi:hypothetical protein
MQRPGLILKKPRYGAYNERGLGCRHSRLRRCRTGRGTRSPGDGAAPARAGKPATLGGGTVGSYGLIWVGHNHLAEGEPDTREEVVAYLRWLGGGSLDEARVTAFVDRAPEALRFSERCGVRFRIRGLTDHYYGTAPGARATGRSIEAELISGYDLGDWRECVAAPEDAPCYPMQQTAGSLARPPQPDPREPSPKPTELQPDRANPPTSPQPNTRLLLPCGFSTALTTEVAPKNFRPSAVSLRLVLIMASC